ncbi:MAG: TonB-dependent receptor [Edaphobacter sp.]
MNRFFSTVIALSFTLAMFITPVRAQETRATLSGTVTDASGGVLPNATLQLNNVNTGTSTSATTNASGQYRFLFIDPGTYRLTVDASGFQKHVESGITLNVSQASTVDVRMTIGSQSQTVTVTSDEPLLETEKADRGVVLGARSLEELPIYVRNPIVLVEVVPGITQQTQRFDLTPFTNNGNSQYAVNGITGDATENLLDGAPNDMIYQGLNSIAFIPSVDSVAEFKAITAPYDAQYGRNGGGVISVATKTGTNKFHGTAYDFVQRTFLDANSWANNANNLPKSDQSLDEYGFTLGGPVRIPHVYDGRDKTFFFGGWEGYKQNTNLSTGISVPTALQRAGDFSQTFNGSGKLITIYNPNSGRLVNGVWTRDPYPGNKVPQGDMDPVGKALANLYPLPNSNQSATVNWQNNYYTAAITNYSFNNVIARVDHTFSDREKVYARYAWNKAYIHQNSNLLTAPAIDDRFGTKTNNDLVADSVSVLTPNLVFDAKVSVTRWTQNFLPPTYGTFDATQIGMPAGTVNQFQEKPRFPYVTLTASPASNFPNSGGTAQFQYMGESSGNIYFAPTTAITAAPTVIYTRGRQSIKTGLDYRWTRFASYQGAYAGGAFNVTSNFTQKNYLTADSASGNSVASLLLGAAYQGEVDVLPKPYWSIKYYGMWVQDDIKLTSRLTINAGLRYDLQAPITERHNIFNHGFDFGAVNPINATANHAAYGGTIYGGLGFAGVNGNSRSPFNTDYSNIQPRIGAAYRITNGLVLRGGYGIFYVPQFSQASQNGFSQPTPFVGTLDSGATIADKLSNPFPSGVQQPAGAAHGLATLNGNTFSFSDPSGAIGHVQSFSFGLEKQLPARMTLDAAYVGTRASQLPISLNINALSAANLARGNSDLGGTSGYLTGQVANPFRGQLSGTTLNGATIQRQQLLLPFPQYTSVTEQDIPIGKNWYNALQVTLQQRTWHGLDLTATYTFSKNMQAINYQNPQDAGIMASGSSGTGIDASAFADTALTLPTRSFTPYDRTHRIVVAPVYELPFGKGRLFFTQGNRVVNTLISGWQGSAQFTWQTGAPMTAPTGVALIGNPTVSNKTFDHMFNSGVQQLNGTVTSVVGSDAANPAWRVLPAFAQKPTPQYLSNVRDFWGTEAQITAAKNNYIHDTMNLQFRVEMLNALNHPVFGRDPTVSYSSPTFGQLVRKNGQSNLPRIVQLAVRFVF